jgi:hypothetical protein
MTDVVTNKCLYVARAGSALGGRGELRTRGEKFERSKRMAPTRPHPSAPDKPPANKILGPGVGLIDRMLDALTNRDT